MNGAKSSGDRSSAAEQILAAEKVLYTFRDKIDPDTDEISSQRVATPSYQNYLDNQTAYHQARSKYSETYQHALKTSSGRDNWPIIASTLQLSVQSAYDKWRSSGATEIENALAILHNSSPSITDKI
jgi:hypothetical protein